jgi:hypothetical protein
VGQILREHEVQSIIHFAASAIVPDSVKDPLGYYKNRVFAESSGRIQGMKAQESCAFVSELDFGEGFDLASEMDDKSGEATSATLGFVLLPGFSAGTDGMRRFR